MFAGNSRYAQDFQAVIDRAVAIASLPLKQYQNQQATLQAESAELSVLTAKFTALRAALDNVGTIATGANRKAASSDSAVLTATASSSAAEGTYTLDIRDAGSAATSLSESASITDPSKQGLSDSTSFTLTVKTDPGKPEEQIKTFTFSTSGSSLNALRDAINSQQDLHARATVVNVGTADKPDYRLSIQSTDLAPQTIQLNDGSTDLLTGQSEGSRVTYRLNGGTTDFTSDSRTLALAEGLTVNVLTAKAGSPVTISVSNDSSGISAALTSFANAYNAAVDEMDKNRGSGGGALTGNAVLGSLSSALHQVMFYQGDSMSLSELGLVLDKNGHLSLDSDLFSKATADLSKITQFLGSSTKGFVSAAAAALDGITGTNGSLTSASDIISDSLKLQDKLIGDNQDRVDELRTRLEAQMAAADAMIAQLEQQANYMNSMFQAMMQNSKNQ
jgi:flagellar hook-associated protein 2